jgi:hypothetical protein
MAVKSEFHAFQQMERRINLPASGIEPSQGARGNYQTPHQPLLRYAYGRGRIVIWCVVGLRLRHLTVLALYQASPKC